VCAGRGVTLFPTAERNACPTKADESSSPVYLTCQRNAFGNRHAIIGFDTTLLQKNPSVTGEEDSSSGHLIAFGELTFQSEKRDNAKRGEGRMENIE